MRGNNHFMNDSSSNIRLYLKHIIILVLGAFGGLGIAYYFNLIEFDFSDEILKAKALGIVSVTILSEYPKSKDTLTYVSVLGFPILCSIIPWYLWARNKKEHLRGLLADTDDLPVTKNRAWLISLLLVALFYLAASFNINGFYLPGWNSYSRAWLFLGEDGENLAWVQSIFSGGVYGKDFFCLYGPMLIYPLAWAMKIFSSTVVVERIYRFFLDLIAYSIIIYFLYRTLRWKTTFVIFSLMYLIIFPPFLWLSVNFNYLRFVLGVAPLLLLYIYLKNAKKYFLLLIGIILGQSLLFSQETAVCSIIALLGTLFIYFLPGRDWRSFFRHCFFIFIGGLISIAPMVIYLSLKGAFVPLLDSLYGYPNLVTLGYGGIKTPALDDFLAHPFGKDLFYYGVIFLYVFASIYLINALLLGKVNRDKLLQISLLIFGILLFNVAVHRYSETNVHKVFHPALLLLFLFLDRAVTGIIARRSVLRAGYVILFILLVTSAFTVSADSNRLKNTIKRAPILLSTNKLSRRPAPSGREIPTLKRGGIIYDKETADSIMNIDNFLQVNTKSGDFVFFFPNEAAYYFLFDRNNPIRYAFSYHAITSGQRRELIADLEKNKPVYVVYSKDTWRVDDIPEDIQVPEVVQYLRKNYSPALDLGSILILKRSVL